MTPPPPGPPAPSLSVVVPVHGRPEALARLLDELAAEARAAGAAPEVIVVDDGSTPPVALAARADLAPRLLRHPVRRGANAARRTGLAAATGDLVHFHDSDDGLAPGWLAALRAALAGGADVVVTRRLDETGGRRIPVAQGWFEANAARPDRIRRMLVFRNCLGPFGGVTLSRRALAAATFPDLASSQDWAVFREIYARAPRGAAAPDAVFVYRRDGADRISASPRRKLLGMAALDRPWRGRPFGRLLRLYHLHAFRAHAAALGRPALDRIMRRARLARVAAHLAVTAWLALALGLR